MVFPVEGHGLCRSKSRLATSLRLILPWLSRVTVRVEGWLVRALPVRAGPPDTEKMDT